MMPLEAKHIATAVGLLAGAAYAPVVSARRAADRVAGSDYPGEQPTQRGLDLARYVGRWHELGSVKSFMTQPATLVGTTATYTAPDAAPAGSGGGGALPPPLLAVANRGRLLAAWGPEVGVDGTAAPPDPADPSKLRVQFSLLGGLLRPAADYWVLRAGWVGDDGAPIPAPLAPDAAAGGSASGGAPAALPARPYDWALVGNGNARSRAWVLARAPALPPSTYDALVAELDRRGYDVASPFGLTPTAQPWAEAAAAAAVGR
jgi:lipocalin